MDSQTKEQGSPTVEWSEEFNCHLINGILAPIPLSYVSDDEEDQQESSTPPNESASGDAEATKQQSASVQAESISRRKRRNEGNDEQLVFKLFKFSGDIGQEYLLEMHEVQTGEIDRFELQTYMSNSNWKVVVSDLGLGNHVVVQLLEDPKPLVFHKKYDLSLQERLTGWTVEKRKRGNGKEDKFYYHEGRQFRSFVEVASYILYSSKVKDLKLLSTNGNC